MVGLFHEPHKGLYDCLRVLQACFRKRTSGPRAHLGCGAVDGGSEVVAAGGWTDEARSTVEIYNVAADTWRTGNC